MKYTFIFLMTIILANPLDLMSQEFAPIGATWVYQNVRPENTIFPSLYRFTASRDTFLNGRSARIIVKEALYSDGTFELEGHEIVSSSGDSVFVHYKDEFHLIFDFTREVGDTVVVINEPFDGFLFIDQPLNIEFSHFQYKIDSLSYDHGESDTLITQYVSYLESPYDSLLQWGLQNIISLSQEPPLLGIITQRIGSRGFDSMLGTSAAISYPSDFGLEQLTCYSDSSHTFNFSGIDCDSLIAFYENPSSVLEKNTTCVEVFPNPFRTVLNVKFPSADNYELLLYDISGVIVAELKGNKEAYDLSYLKAGTYILKIVSQDHIYKTFKINKL